MKPNAIRLAFLILFFALALSFTDSVRAQQPVPTPSDDDVNRVAKQLYCPVCENTPLDVCPTQACQEWRELIRLKLSEGWNDQQIRDYFATQYGDRVLSEPPRRGLNWLVYTLPPVIFLAGAALVFLVLRGMRPKTAPLGPGPAPDAPVPAPVEPNEPIDEYLSRIEEELKRAEKS